MKVCSKCKQKKSLIEEFSVQSSAKDGRRNQCKECDKKLKKDYRLKHSAKIVDYRRKYYQKQKEKPGYYESKRREVKDYRKRYPEKTKAHAKVQSEIKIGRLKIKPCEVCKDIKSEAHHDDYSKPLEIRWLCRKHHIEHHKSVRQKNTQQETPPELEETPF